METEHKHAGYLVMAPWRRDLEDDTQTGIFGYTTIKKKKENIPNIFSKSGKRKKKEGISKLKIYLS